MQTGRIEVVLFDESHIETAAALAVERYRLEREQVPELAARHEDKDDILPLLRDLTARNPGVAAVEDGELRGFMVGMSIPNFKGRHRGIYCPEWGHAAAGNQRRRVYQHMYEHISGIWVKNGCYTHAITVFAHDTEALDLWFRSCFGLRVVDALRDLSPVETQFPVRVPDGVEIRRATVDDVDAILRLTEEHQRYMARAPIFVPLVDCPCRVGSEDRGHNRSLYHAGLPKGRHRNRAAQGTGQFRPLIRI